MHAFVVRGSRARVRWRCECGHINHSSLTKPCEKCRTFHPSERPAIAIRADEAARLAAGGAPRVPVCVICGKRIERVPGQRGRTPSICTDHLTPAERQARDEKNREGRLYRNRKRTLARERRAAAAAQDRATVQETLGAIL